MSATSRLWNILRARLGPSLAEGWRTHAPRWREKFRDWGDDHDWGGDRDGNASGSGPGDSGPGDNGPGDSGPGRNDTSGQDPDLARYYANLEVPYGSDLETIEKAWKRLLRKYHPDRHATDPKRQRVANELSGQLNHAYGELRAHLAKRNSSKRH